MLEKLHIAPECDGFLFLAETARNPPVLCPHRHVELELNLVKEGSVRYVVDDRSYHFPRGSLLWLFPDQVHQLVDRTADAEYFVAVFRPRMLRQTCRTRRYAALRRSACPIDGVIHYPLPENELRRWVQELTDITQHGQDPDILNREAGFGLTPGFLYRHGDSDGLNAALRHLLLAAWRLQHGEFDAGHHPLLHPAVRRALNLLNQNDAPEKLDALAECCGVHPQTLSRLFHRQMNIPMSKYRNSVRLARFMQLRTLHRHRSVLECMHEAGFGSYPQFYRVFKEAYGAGPREVLG